jgi:hypothetical protein
LNLVENAKEYGFDPKKITGKLRKIRRLEKKEEAIILSMKIILFDLGDTLEYIDQNKDVLMPGTIELLSAVQDMRDHNEIRQHLHLYLILIMIDQWKSIIHFYGLFV